MKTWRERKLSRQGNQFFFCRHGVSTGQFFFLFFCFCTRELELESLEISLGCISTYIHTYVHMCLGHVLSMRAPAITRSQAILHTRGALLWDTKWEEAWTWSKKRVKGKKYQMPKTMHQNNMVARGPKRLAGRYHQLKTGHCRTGQYLKWTKNSNTAECGRCQYKTQTREHLFKNCDRWRPQQKIMWAEIRKKTGRAKNRFAIRELFADERFTGAILDFLENDEGGGEGGAAGAATRTNGGEGGEIYGLLRHALLSFLSFRLFLPCHP